MSDWRVVQRFALATFYFATGGTNWALNDNWLEYETEECTEWHFRPFFDEDPTLKIEEPIFLVNNSACDQDGRYIALGMSKNNLVGTIPREIGLLTQLRLLDWASNDIKGPIPSHIGQLTKVSRFTGDRNSHTGAIPTEIGLMSSLALVHLANNPFPSTIPTEIGQLAPSLIKLAFLGSGITGYIPTELYLLTNLKEALIQNLQGATGGTLEGIGALTSLRRFDAYDTPYNSTLPSEIGLLTNISRLNLWNTGLYGSVCLCTVVLLHRVM